MASKEVRESSLCDKSKQTALLQSFFQQKHSSKFCDVLMKVCSKEIYAHSNVLAAASPYFDCFLGQEIPRQFSQRSPQIIEIQVDGSEPSQLYEEAVSNVIDFLYTGLMTIKTENVSQVYEISKIMQVTSVVSFCEDFLHGKVEHGTMYTSGSAKMHAAAVNTDITAISAPPESWASWSKVSRDRGLHSASNVLFNKIKCKKLVSVSVQTTPVISQSKDNINKVQLQENKSVHFAEKTEKRKRSFENISNIFDDLPRQSTTSEADFSKLLSKKVKVEDEIKLENEPPKIVTRSGRVVVPKRWNHVEGVSEAKVLQKTMKIQSKSALVTDEEVGTKSQSKENGQSSDCIDTNLIWHNIESNIESDHGDDSRKLGSSSNDVGDTDHVESCVDQLDKLHTKGIGETSVPGIQSDSDRIDQDLVETNQIQEADEKCDTKSSDSVSGQAEVEPDETDHEVSNQDDQDHTDALLDAQNTNADDENFDKSFQPEDYQDQDDDDEDAENRTIKKRGRPRKILISEHVIKKESGYEKSCKEYSCSECSFVTSRVREMSAHNLSHKLEQGICYFCDRAISDKDELHKHTATHKGLTPFECLECGLHFKTRTMLNLHLPKHSDVKPFICELCSMAFKWKHALKNHMVVHSNKREHLCDICGYSTAHKAQLRSHSLIHSGDTFKCDHQGCNFETTKKQNLIYHGVTHTRERAHQCEICGQNFSLLKNMKRHRRLHFSDRSHRCTTCDFASTRYDKLKEHLLKQHGSGTPPERRVKVAEMVSRTEYVLEMQPERRLLPPPKGSQEPSVQDTDYLPSQTVVISPLEQGAVPGLQTKKANGEAFTILTNLLEGEQGAGIHLEQNAGIQLEQNTGIQLEQNTGIHLEQNTGIQLEQNSDRAMQYVQVAAATEEQDLHSVFIQKDERDPSTGHVIVDCSQLTSMSEQPQAIPEPVTAVNLDQLQALEEVDSILVTQDGNQVILNAPSITLQELANVLRQNEVETNRLVSMETSLATTTAQSLMSTTSPDMLASPLPSFQIIKEEDVKTVQYLEVLVDAASSGGLELQEVAQ